MKKYFLAHFLFAVSVSFAQQTGDKVSFKGTDGRTYTGTINEVRGNQYKIRYDGYDYEAWAASSQFTVVSSATNQPAQNLFNGSAAQGLQNIFDFGKTEGWASPIHEKWYNQYVAPLSEQDKGRLLTFISKANTRSAKYFVLASWLAKDPVADLQAFIDQLNAYPESYQQEKCVITNRRSIIQQWEFSCSVTTVQTYLADLCPRYAGDIKRIQNFDVAANNPNHPMAQQQKMLLEKYGGVASARGDFSGKSIGINEALNDYVGRLIGMRFTFIQITEPLTEALGKIRNLLDKGLDVPLNIKFVGTEARHFILVMKYRRSAYGHEYLIYDPWDGVCDYVSESNILQGSLSPLLTQWKIGVDYYYPAE